MRDDIRAMSTSIKSSILDIELSSALSEAATPVFLTEPKIFTNQTAGNIAVLPASGARPNGNVGPFLDTTTQAQLTARYASAAPVRFADTLLNFFTCRCLRPIQKQEFKKKPISKAELVDCISRLIFPSSFIIFNGIYWGVYLQSTQNFR